MATTTTAPATSTGDTVQSILDAVDSVMTTIENIAQSPGINLLPYVSTISSVIGTVHAAYEAGKDIIPYIEAIKNTFDGSGTPSVADMTALDAKIAALEAQVDAPLPPPEDGEPN